MAISMRGGARARFGECNLPAQKGYDQPGLLLQARTIRFCLESPARKQGQNYRILAN
jgi:hypothetical protein